MKNLTDNRKVSGCCGSDCCTEDTHEEEKGSVIITQKTSSELKEIVRKKYGQIAIKNEKLGCGCGCGCSPDDINDSIMQDDYSKLEGYISDADLGLGCGLPTEHAGIKKDDIVVDLGSGAGNDVFITQKLVGENGKVIGIDFNEEMIGKANKNKEKLHYENVEFYYGEIEKLPLENNTADVVISNCVLNLVPDKEKAFAEINRILKPGGHFCISDIVIIGNMPNELKQSAEMYAGCVSGAIQQKEYLNIISSLGFENIQIKKSKKINLPVSLLEKYLSDVEILEFQDNYAGIFSITVVGSKK